MDFIESTLKEKPDTNERGNLVHRSHLDGDRYEFDGELCTEENGWSVFDTDQDAWYFGVWVHLEKRIVCTYAEGDVIVVSCPTKESLKAELDHAEEFYGKAPPFAIGFDMDGSETRYFSERPKVE